MDTTITIIPTIAWFLAAAIGTSVLIIVFLLYLFNHRRISVITELGGSVADLMAKKTLLEADYEAVRDHIRAQKEELLRVDAERAEHEKLRLELDELTRKVQAMDSQNQSLRDEVGRLELEKHQHVGKIRQITEEIQAAIDQRDAASEELKILGEKIKALNEEVRQKEETKTTMMMEFYRLKKDIDEIQARKRDLREKLSDSEARFQSLAKKEQNLRDICARKEILGAELSEIVEQKKAELAEVEKTLRNFDQKREQMIQVEERRAYLEREVSRLEIERNRLMAENDAGGTKNPSKSFNDLLVAPACLNPEEFPPKRLQMDEVLALQKFKDHLVREALVFPDRVVNSFHTSLKCADINPLTVMAGVSGTGKTLLPIKYAQLMGMHLLVMAVQPRWDSPQDMFGFYNYLEKQYKATEMAQALVRMDQYHPFMGTGGVSKDRMLMVLMDEMNLARTEYYFSEFLSKLELRRDVKDPTDPSDRKRAEIVLDLGPSGTEASRLWVGGNVLFVGTMNEDETTQSLSDKVLDRSNVLRFGKPASQLTQKQESHETEKADGFLTHDVWNSWIHGFDEQSPWSRTVAGWTEAINSALQKIGRPFGYRVEKAIRSYVANYPRIGRGEVYKLAFADQIEQKILPKLRGLDVSEPHAAECLTQIQDIIVELGDGELIDAFNEAKEKSNTSLFLWHGVPRR
ncbi:hypothetical protein [Desulfococcus multivorans]|uniref:ATPase associated with various cellular activities AAA_5 n=1 Tax=Desulfococcus multivorans DSM 2059 TaxID=1121405 RepID=S7VFY9_DESML|nr:hypothetical protein [Desulfococcus multivorans]AOY57212.1 conserved uncharacterized protein [Desulfococcus multivorans]AQU99680.1 hypothetical protein B2D07_02030 [Desulfococcus multivorans]EPR43398.1 hypothetical protein dsmv_1189 [Desulfococcus multivorans DSM 2059]SKA25776.1 hypothetical protein SAMN02745446_03574 [Desulfococcus multivorans DSM 2059]